MKTGPLNESELEWLDDVLTKYNTDKAILDVSELDGLLTAVLSSPYEIEPEQWLVAIWGGAQYVPRTEENFAVVEKLTPEAFEESVDAIRLAALDLHAYWMAHPQETPVKVPVKVDAKVGRNDPCPCGSGKKYKQCCLH